MNNRANNEPTIKGQITEFGFNWGAATVTRLCSDAPKGWVLIGIQTKKEQLQIYVTKTGKIRIHNKEGKELKAV